MPWRRAYEAYAAACWTASAAAVALAQAPPRLSAMVGGVCAAMAVVRGLQGLRLLRQRAALSGRALEIMSARRLGALTPDPNQLYLGFGFEWTPVHSQRLYELSKIDYRQFTVPRWALPLLRSGAVQTDGEMGLPYLHGVEPDERPLYRPLNNFEGGTLIVGTTQSGKGVCFGNLVTQAVKRGDVVILIDPKNSKRLRDVVKRACADYRAPHVFQWFHPAFPEDGVRLDFTFNWQKPTEIASRIQAILPPDTAGAFSAFGWDAVNVVVQGLVDQEQRPNLVKLTRYIEAGIEPILEISLSRLFAELLGPGWRGHAELTRLLAKAARGGIRSPTPAAGPELLAYVDFYEHHIPHQQRRQVIDAQVRTFRHPREHYQKITASLLPVLSMLTSGDLGRTLSPDPFDVADRRPILNFEKIERAGLVLYMCLDALPDAAVASAIAALAQSDMAARAGMRYNLGEYRRISLFVDEVSNTINRPLIEILNKGAESGIYATVAMQTLADLADRLGSENAARMALGNLNNLIAFRTKDEPTQKFIVETFGKTGIHSIRAGINTGVDAHLGDFSASESTQITEAMEEMIPPAMLGKLPNLQYFGSFSGGRLVKGRFTLIDAGAGQASLPQDRAP
ncbi:conjugative transfer system coupling protein TraD [Massilia sp. TS11]|uniref:conjugative transfer system coupling protein TraD n=1 Tax=Massilia sp. TS11 TaxID=2908003 RepID=UPI001EDC2ADD|nr:conjugative transfer system coupling protein TraD [Massilia sp. TS11]MCG2583897.1 conjugative transfer system coupling protein TraD [Massilia sp. TS11]